MVTGGIRYGPDPQPSSEIYSESTSKWSLAAALPSVSCGFSAVTLDNSVFVFGKDILYISLFFLTALFF